MEKTENVEAKANFQPPFYIREIDSKCQKGYCLLAKDNINDVNWEYCNKAFSKDKEKAKFHNPFSIYSSQTQCFNKYQKSGEEAI